ncbi:MAG: hypothetical protein ABI298_07970 [Acidimicrobiales bacterium]
MMDVPSVITRVHRKSRFSAVGVDANDHSRRTTRLGHWDGWRTARSTGVEEHLVPGDAALTGLYNLGASWYHNHERASER